MRIAIDAHVYSGPTNMGWTLSALESIRELQKIEQGK